MASEPTVPQIADRRSNNLDFLRFLFASVVLLAHCYFFFPGAPVLMYNLAAFAVNGFFIISGYLILISYQSSTSIGTYLRKRALRIYPAYFACMAFCLFGLAPLGAANASAYFHSLHFGSVLIRTLFFLTPVDFSTLKGFAGQPMSHTLDLSVWTLSYEVACYLMIVVLGVIGALRSRATIAALFVVALIANGVQLFFFPDLYRTIRICGHSIEQANQTLRLVTFFLGGMTMCLYRDRVPYSLTGLLIALPFVLLGLCVDSTHWLGFLVSSASCVATIYTVLGLAFLRFGSLNQFAKWGDFSYGLYLYAWPLQKLIMFFLGPHLSVYTLFLLVFPITCLFAAASWFFLEKPFLRLKNHHGPQAASHERSRKASETPPSERHHESVVEA